MFVKNKIYYLTTEESNSKKTKNAFILSNEIRLDLSLVDELSISYKI